MNVELDKVSGLFYREGTYDLGVIREQHGYDPLNIEDGDVVLDIGGNIGAFGAYAFRKKATRVWSIEPAPDNLEVFELNWHPSVVKWQLIKAALVDDVTAAENETIPFYLNEDGTNKATHTSVYVRGRRRVEVNTIGWTEAVNQDEFTKVKIDIEGAEYSLPVWELPDTVKAVAIEFHYGKKEWHQLARDAHEKFINRGWVADRPYERISAKPRAMVMIYSR